MNAARILGVLFLMIAMITMGCGGDSSSTPTTQEVKKDGWQGMWYAVKKDEKSGVVTNIMVLEIKDQKAAHLTSWELKGNTFPNDNGTSTKILWQSTDLDLAVSVSGKTLEFTVPEVKEMGAVLKCSYDGSKKQLISKEDSTVFSRDEISVPEVKDKNIKAYQEYAAQQGVTVEIEGDMTDSEYMEYVKKNTFE